MATNGVNGANGVNGSVYGPVKPARRVAESKQDVWYLVFSGVSRRLLTQYLQDRDSGGCRRLPFQEEEWRNRCREHGPGVLVSMHTCLSSLGSN